MKKWKKISENLQVESSSIFIFQISNLITFSEGYKYLSFQ